MEKLIKAIKEFINKKVIDPLFEEVKMGKKSLQNMLLDIYNLWETVQHKLTYDNIHKILEGAREAGLFDRGKSRRDVLEMLFQAAGVSAYNYLHGAAEVLEAEAQSDDTKALGLEWAKMKSKFYLPDPLVSFDTEVKQSLKQMGLTKEAAVKFAAVLNSIIWPQVWDEFVTSAWKKMSESDSINDDFEWDHSKMIPDEGANPNLIPYFDPKNPDVFLGFISQTMPKPGELYIDKYTGEEVEIVNRFGHKVVYRSMLDNAIHTEDWVFFVRHFKKVPMRRDAYDDSQSVVIKTIRAMNKYSPMVVRYARDIVGVPAKKFAYDVFRSVYSSDGPIDMAQSVRDLMKEDPDFKTASSLIAYQTGALPLEAFSKSANKFIQEFFSR